MNNSTKLTSHLKRKIVTLSALTVLVFSAVTLCFAANGNDTGTMPLRLGGCGGVYFYAEKGELVIEVFKQDINKSYNKTHLRALLFGPDRTVLDEAWIADDGQASESGPGPVQRVMLKTNVDRPGVYGLNVTVTEDRYGEHMSWGFSSNCGKYLVETSRGHKDRRHEEPIVLRKAGNEGDVGFMPGVKPFSVEITGLDKSVKTVPVYDMQGTQIVSLAVSPEGEAAFDFQGDESRDDALWRLHFTEAQAVINIDGVTRWQRGERWEDISLWTPELSSWFPFHANRWLLTPYSRSVYADAGDSGEVAYTLHNNSSVPKRLSVTLEFDGEAVTDVELPFTEVTIDAYSSKELPISYSIPLDALEMHCSIRATVLDGSGFSTWSSLTLLNGAAPADSPVTLPVKLEPYRHENEQFGYLPDYPLDNQLYFDMENRPFISTPTGVLAYRGGTWVKTTMARRSDTGEDIPLRPYGTKIAFDRDNDVYLLGRHGGTTLLLRSDDNGETYTAWPVPGSGSFDIEQFSGHNPLSGPPPIARFHETERDPDLIWRRINDLDLILPVKNPDGSLDMGEPIRVSNKSIGISVHSGIPSSIVSRGDKVHINWGEATLPEDKAPGVPTFVATYDRSTGQLGKPAMVGYGPPANDIHNSPCITIDSKGFLHVLIGTHGRAFKYVKSILSNDTDGGWTKAVDVGPGLRQTYVGMVCDRDDALHLVFRLWLSDNKYYPASHYANLAYMSKRPGEEWSDAQPLVVAPFSEYSIFYHRLTIDRAGSLFLSYDYWSTFWFYRKDHRGNRRSLLMSPDSGLTWKLAPSDGFR